jgi:hypothetical protein
VTKYGSLEKIIFKTGNSYTRWNISKKRRRIFRLEINIFTINTLKKFVRTRDFKIINIKTFYDVLQTSSIKIQADIHKQMERELDFGSTEIVVLSVVSFFR